MSPYRAPGDPGPPTVPPAKPAAPKDWLLPGQPWPLTKFEVAVALVGMFLAGATVAFCLTTWWR